MRDYFIMILLLKAMPCFLICKQPITSALPPAVITYLRETVQFFSSSFE
jgi:hypothetical protein